MSDFKISVVIPAYNTGEHIAKTIESVLSQTYQPHEILIVDDGSTDNTAEEIKKFEQVTYVKKENGGAASARNKGIETATGDWIAFLDSDDYWHEEHLEKVVGVLRLHPDLIWACGGYEEVSMDGKKVAPRNYSQWIKLTRDQVFENFFAAKALDARIITSGIFIKKVVFDELGLFDTDFITGQDYDMWLRIAHEYPRIGFVWPATITYIRREDSNMYKYRSRAVKCFCDLFERHWQIALSKGSQGVQLFKPLGRTLAKYAFSNAMAINDYKTLKRICGHSPRYSGFKYYVLCQLSSRMPGFGVLHKTTVFFGIKVKAILRGLKLIKY